MFLTAVSHSGLGSSNQIAGLLIGGADIGLAGGPVPAGGPVFFVAQLSVSGPPRSGLDPAAPLLWLSLLGDRRVSQC